MKTNIDKLLSEGASKSTIRAHLVVEGISTKKIKEILDGIESTHTRLDMEKVVKFVREHYTDGVNRRELAKKMEAHGLCKESTAFHYLSLMNFVEEYVKQTLEAK